MKKITHLLPLFVLTLSSLFASPKAVVFDFGGVMTERADSRDVMRFLMNKDSVPKQQGKKQKTQQNLASNGDEYVQSWIIEVIGIKPGMYSLVHELKEQKVRVAMLSNIDRYLVKIMRENSLYEPFDLCLFSCEIGVEKPDTRAYEMLIEALDLAWEDVVFIDDKIENIEVAKRLGIDALLFHSEDQIRKELVQRGFGVKLL